jgi:hypothetical protein
MYQFDPTLTGTIIVIGALAASLAVLFWPERRPEPSIGLSLEAAALQSERNRMHSAAVGVAEDVGMPESMDPAMMDLADRMALEVHEGRRTVSGAIQHMTATARRWTREMS